MKMLSIDSSGKTAAAAVTDSDQLLAQSFTDSGFTHSQTLLPMVDSTLKIAGIDITEIEEFAVTSGPGSFTGLRIGVALAMGLAGDRLCRPVSSLEALAYNFVSCNSIIIPVMDARRQQVYTSIFESNGKKLCRLMPDQAVSVQDVCDRIRQYSANRHVFLLGDGMYLFEDIAGQIENLSFADGKKIYTQGLGVALASQNVTPVRAHEIKINYLRMSQAERELKEKQNK